MKKFLERISSRKFLNALGVEAGALISLFYAPSSGDAIADAIVRVGTIIAMLAFAFGYTKVQGGIDETK